MVSISPSWSTINALAIECRRRLLAIIRLASSSERLSFSLMSTTTCLKPRFFFALPMCLLIVFSLLAEDTFFISRPVSRSGSPTSCSIPFALSNSLTSSSTNTVRSPCTRKRSATLTSAGWSLSLSFLAWVASSSYPTSETFPVRSQARSWRAMKALNLRDALLSAKLSPVCLSMSTIRSYSSLGLTPCTSSASGSPSKLGTTLQSQPRWKRPHSPAAYYADFATPFHVPLLHRSAVGRYVPMRQPLDQRGARERPSWHNRPATDLADALAHGLIALDVDYIRAINDAINNRIGYCALA